MLAWRGEAKIEERNRKKREEKEKMGAKNEKGKQGENKKEK